MKILPLKNDDFGATRLGKEAWDEHVSEFQTQMEFEDYGKFETVRDWCCLICMYMPAIDISLSDCRQRRCSRQ